MSALVTLRSTATTRPWFSAFVAVSVGFIVGLLLPLSAFERDRFAPLAPRVSARVKTALREFSDRSIVEGLGRR